MRKLPLAQFHRLMVFFWAVYGAACATSGQPKPAIVCLAPSAAEIAIEVAACMAGDEDVLVCLEQATVKQILPYIQCLKKVHDAQNCGGACPIDKAAKVPAS